VSAAAVIAIRRKRLVRAFHQAGATDSAHAVTLEQLGQRRSWVFEHMAAQGVFIATEDGRYFMDEQTAVEFLAARRKRALIIAGGLVLVFVAILLAGLIGR